jgi:hypothetical protein
MLTAETIFNYVWQHFCSVFSEAKGLEIGYGKTQNGKVKISAAGLPFFEKKVPFPEEICWQIWDGQRIPFLFQNNLKEVISSTENGLEIQADIIAGAFFFLSSWQEIYASARDKFNRFPYEASLQFKHNFITIPVVNYYFNILKTALERAYGVTLKNQLWSENSFATFLSHDVDHLESAWKIEGIKQLKKGSFLNVAKLGFQKLSGKDHFLNVETVAETVKKYGGVSTFFWLNKKGKYQNLPNADYDVAEPKYQKLIAALQEAGFENGVHGSFGTSENPEQLKTEAAKLLLPVKGNRFHYLWFDPEKTPQTLTDAGIAYDSTLGFAEHFGFRNSYCLPFRPFDFLRLKPYPFLEIPLNLMDTTLWHPNYLQIPPQEITQKLEPMLHEIKKFGGVFGLLWHNENFSELNKRNGLEAFENIMQQLVNLKTTFRTGQQLSDKFKTRF